MSRKKIIVWLPLGNEAVPSSRIRSLTVSRRLQAYGDVENVFPPFELSEAPAALFIEKKCDPQTLEIAGNLKYHGTRIVYDLCDPIWLQEDANRQRAWNHEKMLALADCVTVPTKQMKADLSVIYPNARIHVIPDVLEFDEADYGLAGVSACIESFRIGWIGSSLNMEHIPLAVEGIRSVAQKRNVVFRIITQSHQGLITAVPRVKTEYCPWTLASWKDDLCSCDCVIIPMTVRESTRTKSSNRLQLCLALGLPVIASPLPSYLDLMQHDPGIVDFAEKAGDWEHGLNSLLDFKYRKEHSEKGVAFARKYLDFKVVEPLWRKVLTGH